MGLVRSLILSLTTWMITRFWILYMLRDVLNPVVCDIDCIVYTTSIHAAIKYIPAVPALIVLCYV